MLRWQFDRYAKILGLPPPAFGIEGILERKGWEPQYIAQVTAGTRGEHGVAFLPAPWAKHLLQSLAPHAALFECEHALVGVGLFEFVEPFAVYSKELIVNNIAGMYRGDYRQAVAHFATIYGNLYFGCATPGFYTGFLEG